jgi:hypothetical protein
MIWSHPKMPFPQRVRLLFGYSVLANLAMKFPVLLIRDVYPGSWIPDPNFFHPRSRILDQNFLHPVSLIQDLNIFHPGSFNQKKWFLSSQKYDPSFRSQIRIWILTFYLSQIPILDPRSRIQGSKRHRIPDPGSRIRICNIGDFGFAQAVGGSVDY